MKHEFSKTQIAMAVTAALGATLAVTAPPANADKPGGTYVTGDFHNHTTCSDGSISMQRLVAKSTQGGDAPWGLDWFVQAGHGGNGNRNCTLVEDESLATPAYPLVTAPNGTTVLGPSTTWLNSNPPIQPKGDVSGSGLNRNMWRWQAVQEFQYPLLEYLAAYQNKPLFLGVESVVAGHEHTSMAVITGQVPAAIYQASLPSTPGYTPLGNANALAQWQYCFDRGNSDLSRGNTTSTSGVGNNWDCSVTGSLNNLDPSWNATAKKLNPAGGTGTGDRGHNKTVEALKWMEEFHPDGSYYVPAHLERAGPFNPNGNNGFNIEHIRNFNNAAPRVAFGMETQPGHGASDNRGEYGIRRNNFGTGIGSRRHRRRHDLRRHRRLRRAGRRRLGCVARRRPQLLVLRELRLAQSRFLRSRRPAHDAGLLPRRVSARLRDGAPGSAQQRSARPLSPQEIVDGLRSGNSWTDSGQLVDRLAFVACADTRIPDRAGNAIMEAATVVAAVLNTDVDLGRCATMGEKLVVQPGEEVVVASRRTRSVRHELLAVYVREPVARADRHSAAAQQARSRPRRRDSRLRHRLSRSGESGRLRRRVAARLDQQPEHGQRPGGREEHELGRAENVQREHVERATRCRGRVQAHRVPDPERQPVAVPAVARHELAGERALRDGHERQSAGGQVDERGGSISGSGPSGSEPVPENGNLRIPCTTVGTNDFDGCPAHLGARDGVKYSSYDVAAWADLWFYSNPIYIEVQGGTTVAGVQ